MSLKRRIILLGSTGSIGVNTLAVVRHLRAAAGAEIDVIGLAAGSNARLLAEQCREFGPEAVAIASKCGAGGHDCLGDAICGTESALELVRRHARRGDMVVGAMVGAAGIAPILEAVGRGCDIALANKETLVAAGALVTDAARRSGSRIIPVDSEHSAIMQCLRCGDHGEVRRIVLTASGGPFRSTPRAAMESATLEDALKHPTWSMGRKVTIDSATMMNKALEIVEAHWLFGLPAQRIDALVHPQSIVHSFVEFHDSSVIAQISPPDMKLPIQLALTWPDRFDGSATAIDWTTLRKLEFEPIDHEKFPAVSLAWRVIRSGGTAGAILNAANEAAVGAFIDGRINFGMISRLVGEALDSLPASELTSLQQVKDADAAARAWVAAKVDAIAEPSAP